VAPNIVTAKIAETEIFIALAPTLAALKKIGVFRAGSPTGPGKARPNDRLRRNPPFYYCLRLEDYAPLGAGVSGAPSIRISLMSTGPSRRGKPSTHTPTNQKR